MRRKELDNIVDYLLLENCYVIDASLFHGKAGVMLSLYAYSKKYAMPVFREFSDDMLQELYGMINKGLPFGVEKGLSGIGLAVTLLSNANLICCDLNDALCDIDESIMSNDPRRMKDMSFRTGAFGLWVYINERMKSDSSLQSIDERFIHELHTTLVDNGVNLNYKPSWLLDELKKPDFDCKEYLEKKRGIDGGSAYFIIKDAYDTVFYNK